MDAVFLAFYFLGLYGGMLLPIPCLIFGWRDWIRTGRKAPINKPWRRLMSQIALSVCSLGVALWVYTALAEARGTLSQQHYYGSRIMFLGVAASAAAIAVSAFSEGKLRRYLLVCAAGLLGFFCFGAGEAI